MYKSNSYIYVYIYNIYICRYTYNNAYIYVHIYNIYTYIDVYIKYTFERSKVFNFP